MSRPMVSPNCPFTARASAVLIVPPHLLQQAGNRNKAGGQWAAVGSCSGQAVAREKQRSGRHRLVAGRLAGSCCRGGLAGAG